MKQEKTLQVKQPKKDINDSYINSFYGKSIQK